MYPNTMPEPTPPRHDTPHAAHAPHHPHAPRYAPPAPGLWQVPKAFWVGLVLGAAAFVVNVTTKQVSVGSGGYSCSYTNLTGIPFAVAILACLATGWTTRARAHVNARLAVPVMIALSVALLALSFVHVLRGTGTIANPCDARPLP